MFEALEVFRITPDEEGKGGHKTAYHSHLSRPFVEIREAFNVHVWQNQWRKDWTVGLPVGTDIPTPKNEYLGLTAYVFPSALNPRAQPNVEVISHSKDTQAHFWNHTLNGEIANSSANPTYEPLPASFATIRNRLFVADGACNSFVYGGGLVTNKTPIGVLAPMVAPTITFTQTFKPDLEPGHPHPWPYISTYAWAPYGGYAGTRVVGIPATTSNFYLNTGFYDALALLKGGMKVKLWDPVDNVYGTFTLVSDAQAGISYSYMPLEGPHPIMGGYALKADLSDDYVTIIPASATEPYQGASDFIGLSVEWAGAARTIGSISVDPVTGDPRLVFAVNEGIITSGEVFASRSFAIRGITLRLLEPLRHDSMLWTATAGGYGDVMWPEGGMSWDAEIGPGYAYAYYDPVTGHVSNLSPITYAAGTQKRVIPVIDVAWKTHDKAGGWACRNRDGTKNTYIPWGRDTGIQYLSEAGTELSARYTKILWFRTALNGAGGVLFPMGSLDPASADFKGIPGLPPESSDPLWIDGWRDTSTDDSVLLVSGALVGPQFTNEALSAPTKAGSDMFGVPWVGFENECPTTWAVLSHLAYWDGRPWAVTVNDPTLVVYGCDEAQAPFGRPEESFHARNRLRIPASASSVTGMKVIAGTLVIFTRSMAYVVAGSNEGNYRLVRISTHASCVTHVHCVELPGETEESGAMAFIGRDKIVYVQQLGRQPQNLSTPIQDELNAAIGNDSLYLTGTRLHYAQLEGRRILSVYVQGFGWQYDLDSKVWTKNAPSDVNIYPFAFETVWGGNNVQELVLSGNGNLGRVVPWLSGASVTTITNAMVKTFPLDFDGKKTFKALRFVRIYVSQDFTSPLKPWTCYVRVNEKTVYSGSFGAYPDETYSIYPSGATPVEASTAKELIVTAEQLTRTTLGDGSEKEIVGQRMEVTVVFPQNTSAASLYAIDIGVQRFSEDGVTGP